MNVLVVGGGGREHALAWKIAQSPLASTVFVAPGNAGTAADAVNVPIAASQTAELIQFAKRNAVDLTVVGPEGPLCAGIVDAFRTEKLKIFGPSKAAAQLEGSKVFCKKILRSAAVPVADDHVFSTAESAERFVQERFAEEGEHLSLVVKADGLASGKGAIVCRSRREVFEAIDRIARRREFGAAGDKFMLEEFLAGEECSVLAITDGRTILTLPPAQDHKRALDGDRGPNTGGMGAYSPAPILSSEQLAEIEEKILVPTVHSMNRAKCRFTGILYAGLMLTVGGPRVLEYNVRFGDPECQPLLMRLDSDLLPILWAVVEGRLHEVEPPVWSPQAAVCVVMASEGYPNDVKSGLEIRGLDEADALEHVKVFHAGTKLDGGKVRTAGGRVLGITARGDSIAAAKLQAYRAVKCIRWPGAWCRKDISDKAFRIEQARLAQAAQPT